MLTLGIALLLLWLTGMADRAAPWLSWADGSLGFLSIAMAGLILGRKGLLGDLLALGGLAAALLACALPGLLDPPVDWLSAWNLVFALGAAGLAMARLLGAVFPPERAPRLV
ncbi:MAG TPA: hypothetical protein VH877_20365 [Polyangia bacterium]|jgi:hypothetical protein|nr:hypothetical protein [Polyangia bacterium]